MGKVKYSNLVLGWQTQNKAQGQTQKQSFKLLVIISLIKLYAQYDIFKFFKRKHGQNIITVIQPLEKNAN